jgi:hypothetical protein
MKSTKRMWTVTALALLLACAEGVAQLPQPSPGSMRGMRLRGGIPFFQRAATPARIPEAGTQSPEAPALTLTWGIYTFPGTIATYTGSVNKSGHMVGGYGPDFVQDLPSDHAFLLKGNKFTTIDYPGAGWNEANAISDGGVIVGTYGASYQSSDEHGFKLVGSTYTSIDYPGATGTGAAGINKKGDIVGFYFPVSTPEYTQAYLLSGGVFTNITFPGALATIAWGINNAGEIVGWYIDTSNDSHGFLLSSGTFTTIDYPGYSQNYVAAINNTGLMVGGYGDITSINGVQYQWEHGYVYQSGTFTTFDAPFGPSAATQVWRINDQGIITGFYADSSATPYGFEVTVGP